MGKQALVLIDLQNGYFPGGKFALVGTEAAADNAAKLMAKFRDAAFMRGLVDGYCAVKSTDEFLKDGKAG